MSFGDILGGMLYVAGAMAAQEMEKEQSSKNIEKINIALKEEFGNKNVVEILNGYLSSSQKELLIKAMELHEVYPESNKNNSIDAGWSPEDIRTFDRKYSMYAKNPSYDAPSYIAGSMTHIPRYKIYERYNAYKKMGI